MRTSHQLNRDGDDDDDDGDDGDDGDDDDDNENGDDNAACCAPPYNSLFPPTMRTKQR